MGKAAKDEAIARRVAAGTMGAQGIMANGPLVGFYACGVLARLVRVKPPDGDGPVPKAAMVKCACGREHRVGITWRALQDGEELDAEVTL